MCEFFSFLSDGKGSYIYADAKTRKYNHGEYHDSHTWLAKHFLGEGASKLEDLYNKYEYNPFTRELKLDNRGQKCGNDFDSAERWCNDLNFKRIIPTLIVQKPKNPLTGDPISVSPQDIENLNKLISVSNRFDNSVWNSIGNSIKHNIIDNIKHNIVDSVCNSTGNKIMNSVWNSVWYNVWNSVKNSVGDSVWNNVWNKVGDSIGNSVWNYIACFFDIKYDFDITPGNALWNRGFFPTFDGTTWRLHSGKDAKIVHEMKA